jgi:hypothetical protein
MQQRQLRLGDILDDYCPRERRVTNHAVVAMIGQDVKQTRCTTCDADHEYKHAKVPRQRKKADQVAPSQNPAAAVPAKKAPEAAHIEPPAPQTLGELLEAKEHETDRAANAAASEELAVNQDEHDDDVEVEDLEEGPVHRPLIRATLPRPEGQAPPTRPAPDFTIRQPNNRAGRFRARNQRGAPQFGNRSNGNVGGFGPQGQRGGGGRPGRPHGRRRQK